MKKVIYLTLCMLAALTATAQDRLYINNFELAAGETKTIEILFDNETAFSALQADIFLPEGLSVEEEDDEYIFNLTDRKTSNHTISSQILSSGAIRILISSQKLKELKGNSGALVTFNIIANGSFSGKHTIELQNVIASTAERVEHRLESTTCTINDDGGGDDPQPQEGNSFYINDFSITAGETKQVEIMLDNETVFSALQADIFLPEGLSIEEEDDEYIFNLTDRKTSNHTISSQLLSSGAIRILVSSQKLKELRGNSGALVTFNIIADASFSGTKQINMNNIIASTAERVEHRLDNTSCTVTAEGGGPAPTQVTSLITTSCDIPKGVKIKFNVAVNPSNADNPTLAWSSSDTSVATVTDDGIIETLGMGGVTITATTTDGSNIALNYVINVTAAQPSGNQYDVDGNGVVNGSDVTALYNYLLR